MTNFLRLAYRLSQIFADNKLDPNTKYSVNDKLKRLTETNIEFPIVGDILSTIHNSLEAAGLVCEDGLNDFFTGMYAQDHEMKQDPAAFRRRKEFELAQKESPEEPLKSVLSVDILRLNNGNYHVQQASVS